MYIRAVSPHSIRHKSNQGGPSFVKCYIDFSVEFQKDVHERGPDDWVGLLNGKYASDVDHVLTKHSP